MKNAFVPVHLSPDEATTLARNIVRTSGVFVKSRSCATLPVAGLLYEYSGVGCLRAVVSGAQAQVRDRVANRAYRNRLGVIIISGSFLYFATSLGSTFA